MKMFISAKNAILNLSYIPYGTVVGSTLIIDFGAWLAGRCPTIFFDNPSNRATGNWDILVKWIT